MNQQNFRILKIVFSHRLPFDWKTPHGYLIALILESIVSFTAGSIVVPPVCFVIGACLLITTFVNNIAAEVPHLNVNKRSDGKNQALKSHFCNVIRDIADAKQFSKMSGDQKMIRKNTLSRCIN